MDGSSHNVVDPGATDTSQADDVHAPLKVVVYKDKYQSSFMSPRHSRHQIVRSKFAPFNKIKPQWDGFTMLPPFQGEDLVHAHNRIPFGAGRYICSFESSLPRAYGITPGHPLIKIMQGAIEGDRCRRLIGMSHYAKRNFLRQHEGDPALEALASKLLVRHPNVTMGSVEDPLADDDCKHLTVTFVGGHFGRKGGAACVRAAEMALERKLPVTFNIISSLMAGEEVWFDPSEPGFFDPYFAKLDLPNIHHEPGLGNAEVRALMARSHFTLLPTLGDTFGYSMIESMAEHTPVIGSAICAVPEVVAPGLNGYLLDLPTTPVGEWVRRGYFERGTQAFADQYRDANESLAVQMVDLLESLVGKRDTLQRLRKGAYETAGLMFSAQSQGALWDELYERVAGEDLRKAPRSNPALEVSSPEDPAEVLKG
ncbi:MAG: glycosyltransferase family 4 protein [Hyphomonas sp.]